MIVVIADDLSGAAELAGAALNHGLRAEVQTTFARETAADVVCVDTDTRSLSGDKAAALVTAFARKIAACNPEWIYKKTDSVLRGNVLAEIRALIKATNGKAALLISANPTRGRIIRGGKYFVNGQPLHATPFANDPEHPRRTSQVSELLGAAPVEILTPDAESTADLEQNAQMTGPGTLPAGGVEFFEALLRTRGMRRAPQPVSTARRRSPMLFVCGSAAAWTNGRGAQAESRGIQVEPMPEQLLATNLDSLAVEGWSQRLATTLRSSRHVMAAIARAGIVPSVVPSQLAERLA